MLNAARLSSVPASRPECVLAKSPSMEDLPAVMEQRMTAVRKGQFDVEIVQSVQQRKVLYDKSHEHHKNPRVKEVEWQRIGEELQVPAGCVIKRWTVIRERFASEKRKLQQLGPSSWWLMNHMNWLDVHVQLRQGGRYADSYHSPPAPMNNLPLPNLRHISELKNFSNANYSPNTFSNNSNTSIHYVDVGRGDDDDDDSRSHSPIMSIAYPEVLMKDIGSDEKDGSYNSTDGRQSNQSNNHQGTTDSEARGRRGTGSDNGSQAPLTLGLDVDEAAAARMIAALKSVEDPILRHNYRQIIHQLSEECELAALQSVHKGRRKDC